MISPRAEVRLPAVFEIGSTLRDARERRGLTVAECEEATRIRAKHLRAMEAERFDLLPEPAFVRSFLRTYARHLGVDEDLVLDEYGYRLEPRPLTREHELVAPLPRARGPLAALGGRLLAPRRPSAARQVTWLALGGAGAVAVLVWAGGVGGERAAPPVPADPAPAGVATETTPRVPAGRDAPPAGGVRLRLAGVGAGSWVQVRRGSAEGRVIFEGTVAAGQARVFRDPRRIAVRVGWAQSLRARVNGRPVALGRGTRDLTVTRGGVRAAAAPGG